MTKQRITVDDFLRLFGDVEGGLELLDGTIWLGGVPFDEIVTRYTSIPDASEPPTDG